MLLTLRQRFILFICIALVGFFISGVISSLIIAKFGMQSTVAMRIAAVMQSLFQLIVPAIATAMIVTRRPATFLAIDRRIDLRLLLLAAAALITATPMMNRIIALNEAVTLPDSLAWLEQSLKQMEEQAAATIAVMQGGTSVGDLIMNILIIGVLAGLGEELIFRGTFLRLMTTGRINPHIAVWTVAVVFSAVHLQFYGFVPRTLLGAYFGYLVVWTRCLWIPVIIHALNNIIYVSSEWIAARQGLDESAINGYDGNLLVNAASVIITAALLVIIYRLSDKSDEKTGK